MVRDIGLLMGAAVVGWNAAAQQTYATVGAVEALRGTVVSAVSKRGRLRPQSVHVDDLFPGIARLGGRDSGAERKLATFMNRTVSADDNAGTAED